MEVQPILKDFTFIFRIHSCTRRTMKVVRKFFTVLQRTVNTKLRKWMFVMEIEICCNSCKKKTLKLNESNHVKFFFRYLYSNVHTKFENFWSKTFDSKWSWLQEVSKFCFVLNNFCSFDRKFLSQLELNEKKVKLFFKKWHQLSYHCQQSFHPNFVCHLV